MEEKIVLRCIGVNPWCYNPGEVLAKGSREAAVLLKSRQFELFTDGGAHDNLPKLRFVSEAISSRLIEAGIHTFEQLAAVDDEATFARVESLNLGSEFDLDLRAFRETAAQSGVAQAVVKYSVSETAALPSIPGVGESSVARLLTAEIDSEEKLRAASAEELEAAGLSKGLIAKIAAYAKEHWSEG